MSKLEILGNWRESGIYFGYIQTVEPALADGEWKRFEQELRLPAGSYVLELEYNAFFKESKTGWDWRQIKGIELDGKLERLEFKPVIHSSCLRAVCRFAVNGPEKTVTVVLRIPCTRPLRAWIHGIPEQASATHFFNPVLMGSGELVAVHGVPFPVPQVNFRFVSAWPVSYDTVKMPAKAIWPPLVKSPVETGVYRDGLLESAEGRTFECWGATPEAIHFVGMIHSMDISNGSWYSPRGDNGYSHFVGDRVGRSCCGGSMGRRV